MMALSLPQQTGMRSPSTKFELLNIKGYETDMFFNNLLAVSLDGSIWIGDGVKKGDVCKFTSLQNVKVEGNKLKVISCYNMMIRDIAVTPTNDILLATGRYRLMQITAGSDEVTDSIYCADKTSCGEFTNLFWVHVTKDGNVIASGIREVFVMDKDGNHLRKYGKNKNYKSIFDGHICNVTSTLNGNIFVSQLVRDEGVVVLGKPGIISIYRGHPSINRHEEFYPSSLITTPRDNVIVADGNTHTLHLLDNTGRLLTTYSTENIGIRCPRSLAITMEGTSSVLYVGHDVYEKNPNLGKLYKMNIVEQ